MRLPQGRDRAQAIAQIESDPSVAYAEPNFIYRASGKPAGDATPTASAVSDPLLEPRYQDGNLWGLAATPTVGLAPSSTYCSQAAAVWSKFPSGASPVYVGVIDEGIKYSHSDLVGQVGNPGEIAGNGVDDDRNGFKDDVYGWDFAGNNSSVYDTGRAGNSDNDGTHVAGTIAAKANGSGVVGVAPTGVRLISGKFLGTNGGTLANATRAVDYFTDSRSTAR